MRIAVIGAGIAGLVAAVGLQRDGHEVTVFEQRDAIEPVGAGLTLFGNAFAALESIGLADAVREVSSGAIASMRAGQRRPSGRWMIQVPKSAVASLRSVHRAELHRVLTAALDPESLRLATTVAASPDGSPELTLNGSATATFDLIVAADGIHSATRSTLGLDPGLHYSGYTAWRGVTAGPVELRGEAGETWGRGGVFGIVPLPDDRVYWFATANVPAGSTFDNEREALLARVGNWHDPIPQCIEVTPIDRILRHDIHDLARPLPTFTKARTVLLGDAAHAMTPNLGQGAGQGLEDAATLVALLRGAGSADLTRQLAQYSALRCKRTAAILRRSRMVGKVAQATNPVLVSLRDAALTLMPGGLMGAVSTRVQRWKPHV